MTQYQPKQISDTTICPECGSEHLIFDYQKKTHLPQGKLRTHDVDVVFFQGCEECSETLKTISIDEVVKFLNH